MILQFFKIIYKTPIIMHREEDRIKTFEQWPVTFLSGEVLARNGFYYIGRGDEVRCAFCKVELMKWVEGDDPAKDHEKWAPQCPFLRGRDTRTMTGPVHQKYSSEAARLRSFQDWPKQNPKPEDLVEAGFFYTGQGDKTKCFYCDGGLKDWENDDVPWEQHARWFDRCYYVELVKGKYYIQNVMTKSCLVKPASDLPASTEDSKSVIICKICYEEECNVCFVPCGHVISCAKCSMNVSNCPMCRTSIHNIVRLYFS